MPQVGYGPGAAAAGTVAGHLLYMVSHGSIWHLAGNLLVLWMLKKPLYLGAGLVVAFACSWVPAMPGVWEIVLPEADASGTVAGVVGGDAAGVVTMGFSGVLFGIFGVKWGRYCGCTATYWTRVRMFGVKVLPWALVGALLPHINWSLHLYCLLAGFAYGWWRK